jgi:hypothetical protein
MGKALQRVASLYKLPTLPQRTIDDIVNSARGDLRHAVTTLQFMNICAKPRVSEAFSPALQDCIADDVHSDAFFSRPPLRPERDSAVARIPASKKRPRDVHADSGDGDLGRADGLGVCGRDDFLDSLHALGKLMYAKRGHDGQLEFVPESIIAGCAYDAATTMSFLTQNAVGMYQSLSELHSTLDLWSAVDVLLENGSYRDSLAEQCCASLVSRSISTLNRDPAPRTFKEIRKPQQFSVQTLAADNRLWISSACLGLLCNDLVVAETSFSDCRVHVPCVKETCCVILPHLAILSQSRPHGTALLGAREFSLECFLK